MLGLLVKLWNGLSERAQNDYMDYARALRDAAIAGQWSELDALLADRQLTAIKPIILTFLGIDHGEIND